MTSKTISSLSGLVIGIVAIAFVMDHRYQHLSNEQLENKYHTEELELQTKLDKSDSVRKVMELRVDSLTASHREHHRQDSILEIELAKVPGTFKDFTSVQLENRMNEEYNKRK